MYCLRSVFILFSADEFETKTYDEQPLKQCLKPFFDIQ